MSTIEKVSPRLHSVSGEMAFWVGNLKGKIGEFYDVSKYSDFLRFYLQLRKEIEDKFNLSFQIFRPEAAASLTHLKFVVFNVHKAFKNNNAISNSHPMEFLLYLALSRQISDSIKEVGFSLPSNKEKIIRISVILFGREDKIPGALSHIQNKFSNFSFTDFPTSNPSSWEMILRRKSIYLQQILNILRCNGLFVSQEKEENLCQNPLKGQLENLVKEYGVKEVSRAISEALESRMVELYINNYKKS